MCLAQSSQRSDAGEARTRRTSVSSQALYHWATALPILRSMLFDNNKNNFNYLVMFCHNVLYFILITKNNQNMQVSIVLDSQDR